jgi:orotidine-5'-phosphate decarboxylase
LIVYSKGGALAARDQLIVALDVSYETDANRLIAQLREIVGMFKIGSQLFTAAGPSLVRSIIEAGNKVFLDLKFHDIPHQVAGAARSAAELGVTLFTVHASGGSEMMERARDAVAEVAQRTGTERSRVVAVSVLTSIDAATLTQIGINDAPLASVQRLVKLARSAGVDGVVASPQEAQMIRSITSDDFLIVTPGIRSALSGTQNEDQKRVGTPAGALQAGANYLVVGRPITSAPDPVKAAQNLMLEMETVANDMQPSDV